MAILIPPPVPGQNSIYLWHNALEQARNSNEKEIHFSSGKYEFFPEGCSQRYCWFSNNDEGVKTIALDLLFLENLTITGENTELYFHGRISPLVAENCKNLQISGLTVDFEESFVSDADIVDTEGDIAWVKFGGKHWFQNGRVYFIGDFYDNLSGKFRVLSYDTEREEVIWNQTVVSVFNSNLQERNGLIGIPGLIGKVKSNALIVRHENRLCPGMVFHKCSNVTLTNITLHHAAGMGVLAQVCTNVSLDRVNILPRGRRTAVSDDAVHIVECRGHLTLKNCDLRGTLDDSLNVHGVYFQMKLREPGWKYYYLQAGHFQQQGVQAVFPGDTLELLKNDTLKPYSTLKIKEAYKINKMQTFIGFDEKDLPSEWCYGDNARVLESAQAELEVINCTFAPLNGRGVLASGLKKAVIKNNYFHTSGAGIFVSGDGRYWYETGPVEEMEISENLFDNCCYNRNDASREPVAVFPELHKIDPDFFYHGRIAVTNNRFISSRRPQIAMTSVRAVEISGNILELDDRYPYDPPEMPVYSFTDRNSPCAAFRHCNEITYKENIGFFE